MPPHDPLPAAQALPPARHWRWLLGVLLAGLAAAGIWWLGWGRRHTPLEPPLAAADDPRRSYTGPFRNVNPDVQYVGDARCAGCHPTQTTSFRRHPMGRSLVLAAQLAPCQLYDTEHHNPFLKLGSRFQVQHQDGHVRHQQVRLDRAGKPIYDYEMDVHYVIGSGRRGYSYLTSRPGREGEELLFQTPISWFSARKIWDLSPGFAEQHLAGRPVLARCLYCHANQVHPIPGSENGYRRPVFSGLAIGCERCHGPGERHCETQDPLDIVNPTPKRMPEPHLRDAVCSQCHLEGAARVVRGGRELFDFRPGMSLEQFWSVFVLSAGGGANRKAVNHVEQMYQSRCFQGSSGENRLGCTSCHDPHEFVEPQRRASYYRQRCLACHTPKDCGLSPQERLHQNRADSCIDCHMPPYGSSDVVHVASTDHRILAQPMRESPRPESGGESRFLLAAWDPERMDLDDPAVRRDLGIALVHVGSTGRAPPPRAGLQALPLLGEAVEQRPDDVDAWEAQAWALMMQAWPQQALDVFEKALERDPRRENSLAQAARLARELGRTDAALDYYRRAAAVNPWMPGYRKGLVQMLMSKQRWEEARTECRAWLRLDPGSVEARMALVLILNRLGSRPAARAVFKEIEALHPANLDQLQSILPPELKEGP